MKALASIAVLTSGVLLNGCAYDYTQRTDRVALSTGNAVRSNLIQSTTNPSSKQMNDTNGLGQNGLLVPSEE